MRKNAERKEQEAAMAWQEERQAEANALQKHETPAVNDIDHDGKEGKGGDNESGRSGAAAGGSTFLFTNVVFSFLFYIVFY